MARKNPKRGTKLPDKEKSRNPTNIINWPPEPSNLEELETQWIPLTRVLLLTWLQGTTERATRASDTEILAPQRYSEDTEWANRVQYADIETGELPKDRRAAYDKAVEVLKASHKDTLEDLKIWKKYSEWCYAQAAWEDFLYFQNEWNRRGFVKDREYRETVAEARKASVAKKNDVNSPEWLYRHWRNELVLRYTKFTLGSRSSIPHKVEPDVAHRYSQPPRGTTSMKEEDYAERHNHLEQKFPGRIQGGDVDKRHPTSDERSVVGFGWAVNETAFDSERKKRDQIYVDSPATKNLLPADHLLHHGVLERSFDWPTSFDAEGWGDTIAVTAIKRRYKYEEEDFEASDGEIKRRPKKDENGHRIRHTEVCGYKKVKQTREKTMFVHDLKPSGTAEGGTVEGRDRGGNWIGRVGVGKVDEFINDPRYKDPEPDVRYRSRNEFKVVIVNSKFPRVTRYRRHVQAGESASGKSAIVDQLSDDEAPDCIKSNVNFGQSGNVKFDSGVARGDRDSAGHEHIYSDDDEDDEDDPFTKSYLECSGKVCNDAKEHLVELKNVYGGATPEWTYHHVVALVDVGATQKEVARIYQEAVQAASRDEHNSTLLVSAARQLLALEEQFGDTDWTISQVAADLLKEPKDGQLAERYQKRVQETEGRAVSVLASLVEEFGDIGWTPEYVAGRLLRETEEVLKRKYKEDAQLLVTTAKKRKAEGTVEPEEPEHGALGDS